MSTNVWKDQIVAVGVDGFNHWKSQSIAKQLDEVVREKLQNQERQNLNFEKALQCMIKCVSFFLNLSIY